MDIIDQANDLADLALSIAIANAIKSTPVAGATGECLNCGEHINPGRRWCDAECREDWESRRHCR